MNIHDFSLMISQWGPRPNTPREIVDVARHAEELGFYSLGVPHVPILPYPEERPAGRETDPTAVGIGKPWQFIPPEYKDYQYDALILLPMLVQGTNRIRLGFNVAVTPWLHPFVWAKYLASLDAASEGRIIAGFGLGYGPPKSPVKALDNLGIDGSKRGRMSDEALKFMTRMWTEEGPVSFDGEFYKGLNLVIAPRSVQRPYPELWWAGDAAPSIGRAARYANYMELGYPTLTTVRERARQLSEASAAVGRKCSLAAVVYMYIQPGATTSRESLARQYFDLKHSEDVDALAIGTPEDCAKVIRNFWEAGARHIVLDLQRHGRDHIDVHHERMGMFVKQVLPLLQ